MRLGRGGLTVLLVVVSLAASGCANSPSRQVVDSGTPPVSIQRTEGSDIARVVLSEDAARRLGVQTVPVRSMGGARGTRTVIPYAAVLYDANGQTWTYTSPEHLVFVRAPISVARIQRNSAILTAGPSVGTEVVTVGESELLGAEYEVGGE